jgi:hypothetical protein
MLYINFSKPKKIIKTPLAANPGKQYICMSDIRRCNKCGILELKTDSLINHLCKIKK